MFRKLSAAALALAFLATPALAMDCEKEFRVRVDHMMEAPTAQTIYFIKTTRFLLQGYDACMKGDMETATKSFEEAMTTTH
jgi:hypothetical protein